MDYLALSVGLVIGGVIAWFMASFRMKSNTVSKAEFNTLSEELNTIKLDLGREGEKNNQISQIIEKTESENKRFSEINNALQSSHADYKSKLESANNSLSEKNEELKKINIKSESQRDENLELNKQVSEFTAINKSLNEKLDKQKDEMNELNEKFNLEFQNIANKIFEDKSEKFTNQNKENLKNILDPLKENIDGFKKKVENFYYLEGQERNSLKNEVKNLIDMNKIISEDANNLTNALKGDSKIQGDWGEMILENILEKSGLVKEREYFVQTYLEDEDGKKHKNEHGKKMQPDAIIKYPGDRVVIIDAKVSLTAYTRFAETDDIKIQEKAIKEHSISVRKHIDELADKSYQDFATSLDFVMMFIPNEPACMLALKNDTNLWHYAYEKKIILISPTNLIMALKLIENLWKREYQNQNAIDIANRGASLYDKFVSFVENLGKVGDNLDKAQSSYDKAFGQLSSGGGNLIGQAEKLKDLGIKTKKSLPLSLVENSKLEYNENRNLEYGNDSNIKQKED